MPEEDFFIEFPPAAEFSSLPDSEPGSTWSLSKLEENNALYKPIRNAVRSFCKFFLGSEDNVIMGYSRKYPHTPYRQH